MADLKFIETLTVEQFKNEAMISRVDVKKNNNTGKLFFSYGVKTGAVSSKGMPQHPIFSLVNPDLDREPTEEEKKYIGLTVDLNGHRVAHPKANGYFYLLHEEGQGGAPVVATL